MAKNSIKENPEKHSDGNTEWVKPNIPKPDIVDVNAELAAANQHLFWNYEEPEKEGDKPKKVPKRVVGGKAVDASVKNPMCFTSMEQAAANCKKLDTSGIGLVLTEDDEYVGIDLDGVITKKPNGELSFVEGPKGELAEEILNEFAGLGYIELSVSETGAHIIVKGRWENDISSDEPKPGDWNKAPDHNYVEVYDRERYFTMSGVCLTEYSCGKDEPIKDAQPQLEWLAKKFKKVYRHLGDGGEYDADNPNIRDEDIEALTSYIRGADFGVVWRKFNEPPEYQVFPDKNWKETYESASELDMAFFGKLAFKAVLDRRVPDELAGHTLLRVYRNWPGYRGEDGERKARYAIAKAVASAIARREEEIKAGLWAEAPMTQKEFEECSNSQAPLKDIDPSELNDEAATYPLAPFRGPMTEIVNHILATSPKPQPELALLSALIAMAASCPGSYSLMIGSMRLNLYGVGISESGSGKDQPRFIAASIVRGAGGKVLSKPASGQALEDELVTNTPMLLEVDEAAYMFQELNGKDASSSTIALARMILMLFSHSRGVYSTRAKARGKENTSNVRDLANPMLNMLGFCTPDKLGEVLSTANIEDGMLGRILFARGRDKVKPSFIKDLELPSSIKKLAERVRLSSSGPNRETGGVCYLHEIKVNESDDARVLLQTLMVQSSEKADDTKDPLTKILLIRTFEKLYRVAGVLAVWDNPEKPVINVEHLDWARQFVDTSDETVIQFCKGHLHGGKVQADASKILTILKRVVIGEYPITKAIDKEFTKDRTTTRSLVLNKSKLSKKDFDDAVSHLVDAGKVTEITVERKDSSTGRATKIKLLSLDQECDL